MQYKTIIDISLPLYQGMITYPANPPFVVESHPNPSGQTVISALHLGSHTGTHVDAPYHAVTGGLTLDKIPLDRFIGLCKVFDFSSETEAISEAEIRSRNIHKGDRILLKTHNSIRGFETFYDDYVYLSGDAADYLAEQAVALVGIDALSIKQRGSKDLRPHTSLLSHNIPIIEGLNLNDVAEREYFLCAAPLKLDIDGSPLRAVLLAESEF